MAGVIVHNEEAGMPTSSYVQIFKVATISSVQILVLVIAGTSGFIVSLLGLIIPDALKGGKPATSASSRSSSLRSRRDRSTSPTVSSSRRTSSPPSVLRGGVVAKKASIDSGLYHSDNVNSKSLPMSRGDSGHSTSTVPELGGQSTSNASTSCSSSISDTARVTSSTQHHHHGISANALYEGLVNRYKSKKSTCKKQDSPPVSNGTATSTTVNNEEQATATRSGRRASTSVTASSPKSSQEGMRSRLSSLMIPHHASSNNNNKRLSLDSQMLHSASTGEISPKSLPSLDGPNRTATLEDVVMTTLVEKEGVTAKPPFLSRMFTFSSSSSSTSSEPKSATSSSSSSNILNAKQTFPSTMAKDAPQPSDGVRPRARRLSTRLVSFRSTSNNGSKSRRAISESSESHTPASMLLQEEETGDDTITATERELTSPPQTPRLGSLPSSSSVTWTPGSNASPLRSPLAKRSFFGGMSSSSPSKNSVSSSPANSTLTPKSNNLQQQQQQGRLGKGPSPKSRIERPTLGRRSASDNHTITNATSSSSSSSSSWKNWVNMNSSPGKMARRGTVSVTSIATSVGHPAAVSMKEEGAPAVVAGRTAGQSKNGHARHVSDHAVLPSARENGARVFPLASPTSPPQSSSSAQAQRPRQMVSYRALSYAPPPSHAVLVPLSSTTAAYTNNVHTGRHQATGQQQQQHRQQMHKPFVPFHPFLDERYHESSLDLSGTSGLTMEVHFSASTNADANAAAAK